MANPTEPLCAIRMTPRDVLSPTCILPRGHAGNHEAVGPSGKKVSWPPPLPDAR